MALGTKPNQKQLESYLKFTQGAGSKSSFKVDLVRKACVQRWARHWCPSTFWGGQRWGSRFGLWEWARKQLSKWSDPKSFHEETKPRRGISQIFTCAITVLSWAIIFYLFKKLIFYYIVCSKGRVGESVWLICEVGSSNVSEILLERRPCGVCPRDIMSLLGLVTFFVSGLQCSHL